MSIFDHFERIRIINLPERKDRRRAMDRELGKVGLTGCARLEYFDAIRPTSAGSFTSIGARGVYESQKALLQEAARDGVSLLMLEDDCCFDPGAVAQIVSPNWDILYGGYIAANPDDLMHSDIQGAHMMGFSRKGAKLVSEYLANLEPEGIHPPIDAAYVWFRRAFPAVPTVFAKPIIANQRPSRSDIAALAWYDRTPLIRTGANLLRAVR